MEPLSPTKDGYIEVDNSKIYWEYLGDGDKEVICLMNGVAMYTKSWYNFLPMIYPEYDILLYDYKGQGNSTADDVPYSIKRFCDYLTIIMDHIGIEKLHLMGISYGALVAADYARMYDDRVITLTLSGGFLTKSENFVYGTQLAKEVLQKGDFDIFGKLIYSKIFGDTFIANFKQHFDAMNKKLHDRYEDKMHALVRLIDTQFEFINKLEENKSGYASIKTPTLVIAGKQDVAIPVWLQKDITEIIPNTRMELVDDCGHVVYIEKPPIFFDLLKKLVAAKSLDF